MDTPAPSKLEFDSTAEVDADLVSIWSNTPMRGVTPNTINSFQTQVSRYKDVFGIDDVKICFRSDTTPCIDLSTRQIYLPIKTISEGRFDEAANSIMHELLHAKHSPKFSNAVEMMYNYLEKSSENIIDSVTNCPVHRHLPNNNSQSWKERFLMAVVGVGNYPGIKDDVPTGVVSFIKDSIQAMFSVWNCFEDIRVDSLIPPTLKKYQTKFEKRTWHEVHKEGFLNNLASLEEQEQGIDHPMALGCKALLHFKEMMPFSKDTRRFDQTKIVKSHESMWNHFTSVMEEEFKHLFASIWEKHNSQEASQTKDELNWAKLLGDEDCDSKDTLGTLSEQFFRESMLEESEGERVDNGKEDIYSDECKLKAPTQEQVRHLFDEETTFADALQEEGNRKFLDAAETERLELFKKSIVVTSSMDNFTHESAVINLL